MSLKDIKEYYDKVYFDYKECLDCFSEFTLKAQETIISPEEYEEKRKSIEPVERNYETISYFMFHLGRSREKLKEYYEKTKKVNDEVQRDFRDLLYYHEHGTVDQETVDGRREIAESYQNKYEEISWLMWLLYLPIKQSTKEKYIKSKEKKMSKIGMKNHYDNKLKENKDCIDKLKKN